MARIEKSDGTLQMLGEFHLYDYESYPDSSQIVIKGECTIDLTATYRLSWILRVDDYRPPAVFKNCKIYVSYNSGNPTRPEEP